MATKSDVASTLLLVWTGLNTRTEMYAGHIACCSLESHVEYTPRALLRLEKRWKRQTDRRTDARPMHHAYFQRNEQRNKRILCRTNIGTTQIKDDDRMATAFLFAQLPTIAQYKMNDYRVDIWFPMTFDGPVFVISFHIQDTCSGTASMKKLKTQKHITVWIGLATGKLGTRPTRHMILITWQIYTS